MAVWHDSADKTVTLGLPLLTRKDSTKSGTLVTCLDFRRIIASLFDTDKNQNNAQNDPEWHKQAEYMAQPYLAFYSSALTSNRLFSALNQAVCNRCRRWWGTLGTIRRCHLSQQRSQRPSASRHGDLCTARWRRDKFYSMKNQSRPYPMRKSASQAFH